MEDLIILSVHQIIDLVLREGDIDSRVFNIDSMQRGIQIHKIQGTGEQILQRHVAASNKVACL